MSTVTNIPMVYLGPEPWKGLWRNRHHLMSRFGRDRTVVYVEPPSRLRQVRRRLIRGKLPSADLFRARTAHIQDNLHIFRTGALCPITFRKSVSAITWQYWRRAFRRCLAELEIERYILWISRPFWYPALDQLTQELLIYHVVDEYTAYTAVTEDLRRGIIESEEYTLQKADLVIVVSEALRVSKSKLNRNTHVVANGVDISAYAGLKESPTASSVMADIPRPRIGYSGLIASRLDLALLLELARHRPDYSIVLLGAVDKRDCRSQIGELENLENVHFLGLKPAADVPKYIAGFDVCMIPYARNERARYADPLKLYEYGAAGKEVVCTDFVAVRNVGRFCRIAASIDDFLCQVDETLSRPTPGDIATEARQWAGTGSWENRMLQIESLLAMHLPPRVR